MPPMQKEISQLPKNSYIAPAMGVPIITATPWNNRSNPNADVRFSNPRSSTSITDSKVQNIVKNPYKDTTNTYSSQELQDGNKHADIPLRRMQILLTKKGLTQLKSENHPVTSLPIIFEMAAIHKISGLEWGI